MANMPAPIIQTPTQPSNANITGGTINGQPVANMPTTAQAAAVANLAAQNANTLTGNNTGSPAAAGGLTVAQVKTLLAYVAGDIGAVPVTHTVNAQTGSTYSFALTDTYEAGCQLVTFSYATAVTITVPRNNSVALPVGCVINCQQIGAGKVTFAGQDGTVTINPAATLSIAAQWGAASLVQTAANAWSLIGSLSA
jgi:hypothetical protein